ncbi:Stk1 family PASTA domain-containing Ser/Thr kinase [Saccharopolyspora gloriosae]|uniref:non-specific serine/threonine protein kinase n=1 Tax=Saccharopolyspora gloriosae TaxID=455344 RepID=A0A840NIS2_9PSEU|nr:Stk1 family PASTA domain-containing Ser/Thr kinase [Saccharopolyspora gloriosae]MBB5068177.1 serine/threonine-protein kinase [Saccharopolyspora gloriosae]
MTPETRPGRGTELVGAMLERRYRVDSVIARGGMSVVYRGLDTRLDRPVALKVMDSHYSANPSFVERFELEARSAARLHHPAVVAVYDQGVDREIDGDHVYLVMQLVEGCTLREVLLEQGVLSLPMAVSVLRPMLSALAAAHHAGMVHRDIKPENVLVGLDGSVQVADFGLVRATATAGSTTGNVILGTVAYLSPEQVTTGDADARTDVYSAGVVLYELLTGRPPFGGDTALSVAYQHVNADVPPPSEVTPELPPAIDDLVLRATRRDPAGRPADAAAFLHELERISTELGLRPVPVPVPVSEQRTEMVSTDAGGPPTERIAPITEASVPEATAPYDHGGPQGTRAMPRPAADEETTHEIAAVRPSPAELHEQERKRGGRRFALWTLAILVIAGLLGGTAWWMGSGRYIQVPRVTGETEEVASQVLRGADLTPEITRQLDDDVPAGTVISSSPKQGSRILSGQSVELVVSSGRPKVPDIAAGTSVDDAQQALRAASLQPERDTSADQYDSSIPEGAVISVDPGPGTELAISSQVRLIVSKGPPPVPVPDVTGASKDEAFAALSAAGFEPYESGRQFDSNVEADHVITTDPAANTVVELSGKPRVGVVLSNAVTVPDLNGKGTDQAQQELAALGLGLEVHSFFQRPDAMIIGQLPLPGSKVEPGSTVGVTAL